MVAKVPLSPLYQPLDTNTVASHVSRFPAALSHINDVVTSTLKEFGSRATEPGSRLRAKVKVRHTHPVGDPFAIAHCTTDHERMLIVGRILEILWIHDDITEELSIDAAQSEHVFLADMLRLDIDPIAFEDKAPHHKLLAEAVREAIDFDPIAAPVMLSTMAKYLKTYDDTAVEFDSMEKYIPFRVLNVGYWISSYFIRWGMGLVLSDEELSAVQAFDISMGTVLSLMNDYFSWAIEAGQETDRVRNGVHVLIKQYGLSADVARSTLLGMMIEEEAHAVRLREQCLKGPVSDGVRQYIEAMELYVGGACFWTATAPRYQMAEANLH